jgi:hypothetical protein
MSAVIVLDDEFVERIAREIHTRALQFPTSCAADILPLYFQTVVQAVAATIDLDFPDFDASLWAALGRYKSTHSSHFTRRRSNPGRASLMQFFHERKKSA